MTEPTWVGIVSDHGMVNGEELAEWLGIKKSQLGGYVLKGIIPASCHSGKLKVGSKYTYTSRFWKVKTIRDWIKAGKPKVSPSC